MHYLGLALYAEGPTDYYFLRPLLLRLCEEICLNEANQSVELGEEVISLNEPARMKDAPREERIILKTSVTPPGLHAGSANEGVPVVRWPRWCA